MTALRLSIHTLRGTISQHIESQHRVSLQIGADAQIAAAVLSDPSELFDQNVEGGNLC
jgi:hypothetical protein